MKITILSKSAVGILTVLLFACGAGNKEEKAVENEPVAEAKAPVETPVEVPAEVQEPEQTQAEAVESNASKTVSGEDLIGNSDCLSCHLKERQVVGPAFLDIAAEYANNEENVTMLANKVINGGAGVWGEVPMPPHATLSEEDAKAMVSYILGLI